MASLNKAALLGNLGSDPETRTSQDGKKIVTFSLATHESWRDARSGERVERVTWHRVVVFNEQLADVAEKYLRKGRQVYLEGSIQNRKFTDKTGTERHVTEITLQGPRCELQMLDAKPNGHSDDSE